MVLRIKDCVRAHGWGYTLRSLVKMKYAKPGKLVGVDKFGNKFFENEDEMFRSHRWVHYADPNFDSSHVQPEWYIWLNHAVDEVPGEHTPRVRRAISPPTDAPVTEFRGGAVKTDVSWNRTQDKSRAYGVGSLWSAYGVEAEYYVQPHHVQNKDYKGPATLRAERERAAWPAYNPTRDTVAGEPDHVVVSREVWDQKYALEETPVTAGAELLPPEMRLRVEREG